MQVGKAKKEMKTEVIHDKSKQVTLDMVISSLFGMSADAVAEEAVKSTGAFEGKRVEIA